MNDKGGGGWSTVTVYTKILKYVLRKCSNHGFFYQQTSESYFWFSSVIISPYSIHYNPTLRCWASWSTPSVHGHNLSLRFRHHRKTIFQKLVSWRTYLSRIDIVGSEIGINTIVKSVLIIVVLFLVRIPQKHHLIFCSCQWYLNWLRVSGCDRIVFLDRKSEFSAPPRNPPRQKTFTREFFVHVSSKQLCPIESFISVGIN